MYPLEFDGEDDQEASFNFFGLVEFKPRWRFVGSVLILHG